MAAVRKIYVRFYTSADGKRYAHYFKAKKWHPIPRAVAQAMIATGHAKIDTRPERVSPPPVIKPGILEHAHGSRA
jgi:hypothetical protein